VPENLAAVEADSHARQSAFTRSIWRGVLQDTWISRGLATMIASAFAREVATFSRRWS
jgi:hypothetical protein